MKNETDVDSLEKDHKSFVKIQLINAQNSAKI